MQYTTLVFASFLSVLALVTVGIIAWRRDYDYRMSGPGEKWFWLLVTAAIVALFWLGLYALGLLEMK